MAIKNIIFDLGGVTINIHSQLCADAFEKLGAVNFFSVCEEEETQALFFAYETGKISSEVLREKFKSLLGIEANEEEFDHAWNAMLLSIPAEKIDLLKLLKNKYKIYLFSNTNELHYNAITHILQRDHNINNFNDYLIANTIHTHLV